MDHVELLYKSPPAVPNQSHAPPGGRLVVVSNRVPAPLDAPSAGGLAVALEAALKERGGVWFGWSGESCKEKEPLPKVSENGGVTFALCGLARRDIDGYYHGFANRALWPVCHYRLDLASLSQSNADAYFRVNAQFAAQLQKMLRREDLIWVHDYHLIPVASFLRKLGCTNRIGFFLHIPWPGPEVASALPAYKELLFAFGAYDVAGFQTEADVANFCACIASAGAGRRFGRHYCEIGGRKLRISTFPVGIDTGAFAKEARSAEKNPAVKRTIASLEGRPLIIGVDRLDYSKGLQQRMEAFAHFLERSQWAAWTRVTMLQITPKSRAEVPEYARLQRELAEEAGRINGKFGDVDWTPLRYINKTMRRSTLAGLYRAARAGLVTPLRDGMNLVAKEYVAAQAPDNPGVLVLSQFAGAAQELKSALIVNPYDIEATALAIARALSMPLEERRHRWSDMIAALRANSVHDWMAHFLKALSSAHEGETDGKQLPGGEALRNAGPNRGLAAIPAAMDGIAAHARGADAAARARPAH
ncbi:MAG: trehalose-6-phosphate synthase [Beijerinckiaceae bacterium]|nr:trehalose-6-phosphate synthase [Beijerinckiaceae bacterium]